MDQALSTDIKTGSFYLINNRNVDLAAYEADGISANRRLNGPFQFFLSSNYMNAEGADYIIATCAPDLLLYSASRKENIPGAFYHPPLHRHDYYELMIVLEGELYQNIENIRHYYPMGSACILNPNVRHTEEFITDCRCVYVQMSRDLIRQCFDTPLFFSSEPDQPLQEIRSFFFPSHSQEHTEQKKYIDFISEDGDRAAKARAETHRILDSLMQETLSPSANASSRIRYGFTELLYHLFSTDQYSRTPVQLGSDLEAQLFSEIRDLMSETHGMLGRSELAARFHYSGNYIYKVIRKYTGQNIVDLAVSYRLEEAARLLQSTDLNIEDICRQLGFRNRTHFYRLFKKAYGMTPLAYKKSTVLSS